MAHSSDDIQAFAGGRGATAAAPLARAAGLRLAEFGVLLLRAAAVLLLLSPALLPLLMLG